MSLLTDVSSEMIFAVLPLFLVDVLGVSPVVLGGMEGAADFAASSLDLASGYVSDRTGRRKGLTILGYALSSVSKLALVGAASVGRVVGFRIVERLGKSVRGPPRDALLAAVAPREHRGLAFGVHKAMDKAGAIGGPLIAAALLAGTGPSAPRFRFVFSLAVVPAFLAVAALFFGVREGGGARGARPAIKATLLASGPSFRRYLAVVAFFSLGYSSFAFLLLKANEVGFTPGQVALLYAGYNACFTAVSIPIGRLGDRVGRRALIAASYALYALTLAGLAFTTSRLPLLALFAAHACFFAVDEGQTKAFIADLVPNEVRGTAIGIYGLVTAVFYLPASVAAGALWKTSPSNAFAYGAAVAGVAFVAFMIFGPRRGVASAG